MNPFIIVIGLLVFAFFAMILGAMFGAYDRNAGRNPQQAAARQAGRAFGFMICAVILVGWFLSSQH